MRRSLWLGGLLLAGALPAIAAVGTGYRLSGSAQYVSPGDMSNRAVKLVADANAKPPVASDIEFNLPDDLTINDLKELSTDYDFTASSCGNGSPRFAIELSGFPGKSIFVYIGPPPNYTNCAPGWTSSGNLLTPASLVDDTQLGGTFYDPWAMAQSRYAGQTVTKISLVADNGPSSTGLGSQTVLIDNTDVAGHLYTYEFTTSNSCKNDGWERFKFPPGPFKNQGQCVSYFEHQKHMARLLQ
jgi:hypothetical protein